MYRSKFTATKVTSGEERKIEKMAKANLTLPNGTKVEIEGTPEEVKVLLELYSGSETRKGSSTPSKGRRRPVRTAREKKSTSDHDKQRVDLSEIINLIKSCDEAELIETKILDRISLVDRTLLPMFVINQHLDNAHHLTSGDIAKITTDLGIPISIANVSKTLSNTASKYVVGDKVRKMGRAVGYKLSRRGVQYMKDVLEGSKE